MPSCSSKLPNFCDNELITSVIKIGGDSTVILKDYCQFPKNITPAENSRPKCLIVNGYTSCDANLKKVYKFHVAIVKCEASKIQKISNQSNIWFDLKFYSHVVISLIIIYYWLKFPSYLILMDKSIVCNQKLLPMHKIDCISNGIKDFSVMDIDEPVKEVNSCDKSLENGDKSEVTKPLGIPLKDENSDGVHLTVIGDSQVMNGSEYSHPNNSFEPSIDIKIKEEIKDKGENIPKVLLPNGETNIICHINDGNIKCNPAENCKQIFDNKIPVDIPINSNGSSNETYVKVVKSELTQNLNDEEKTAESITEEKSRVKTIESSSQKDKVKNQYANNNSVNSISSSSSLSSASPKKNSSQSHQSSSSSSSSSSRHKYKDEKHKVSLTSSSNKNNEISSSTSKKTGEMSKSESKSSKSRTCYHKPEDKCHCKSRHVSSSHRHSSSSKKSKKVQSVRTQCTAEEIAFELNREKTTLSNSNFTRIPWVPHPQIANMKYGRYYRIEEDRNGGATVCHLYMDEIKHLPEAQLNECAVEFIKLSYSEDENECAYHVMGIVHGAASYLPDLVDYMADHYPTLIVKTGSLASRDNHTTTMSQYRDEVYKTYSNGTFRYAPLDQLSICGVLGEEVGAYFPDFVARLEQSPFMKPVMPWSFMSVVQTDNPRESNDGPIFWVRPGEQMLPANEALKESTRPKKRRNNELDNLAYIGGSRFSEARESLFMDRTKAHADQVGVDYGITNTAPTAAVGVLKAVNCGHPEHGNRATKDVIAFHAQDYNELLEILMLDLYEPPQTQCTKWIEVSKLNTLKREGIRYAHLQLHDNDVYYLPRKIIHQFQTISSVASVAWHIRYKDYFTLHGAPNLHTPTGINKGQVFYEKKNVALYCPPVHENDLLAAVTGLNGGLKTPKKSERLREYSPFKHSPRKLHKYQSPRSISKKEKQLEESSDQNVSDVKTEPESSVSYHEKSNGSSKKVERSNLTKEVKEEKNKEIHKTPLKSSEDSHCRRSTEEQTPSKKEKSKDSHSNHRKEVKNLEAEFSSKKDNKSRYEKSSKSGHEKSNNTKDRRRSKESRHTLTKSSGDESNSGVILKPKRSKDHSTSASGGQSSHKTKTECKREDVRRKRSCGESPHRSSSKRLKEEENQNMVSNDVSKISPKKLSEIPSENQLLKQVNLDSLTVKTEINSVECKLPSSPKQLIGSKCANSTFFEPSESEKNLDSLKVNTKRCDSEANMQKETNIVLAVDVDLRPNLSFTEFIGQVPPLPPLPPLLPPPPPPPPLSPTNSSIFYPPLPPPPSNSEQLNSNHVECPESRVSQKSNQSDCKEEASVCLPSNHKADILAKKVKKKAPKSDGFDLLGDIMSKMDRKK